MAADPEVRPGEMSHSPHGFHTAIPLPGLYSVGEWRAVGGVNHRRHVPSLTTAAAATAATATAITATGNR